MHRIPLIYSKQHPEGYLKSWYSSKIFQTLKFSKSTEFSSIRPIDITLLGATTPALSGSGSDGNKGVLLILQRSSITATSPLDYLKFWYSSKILQTLKFSISTEFSSIRPIDITLLGAATPALSGSGSDGNKGVLLILQRSSITGLGGSFWLNTYISEKWPQTLGNAT